VRAQVGGHVGVSREIAVRPRHREARVLHPRARHVCAQRGVGSGEPVVVFVTPEPTDIGAALEAVDGEAPLTQRLQRREPRGTCTKYGHVRFHTLRYGMPYTRVWSMGMRARTRLSPEDWAEAALEAIAEGGLAGVAVVPPAERVGATKGSFYWHFPSREALIEAALAAWEQTTTSAVIAEIEAASADPRQQLRLLFKRVTELAARDRIELALLATADHSSVRPVLERVTRR